MMVCHLEARALYQGGVLIFEHTQVTKLKGCAVWQYMSCLKKSPIGTMMTAVNRPIMGWFNVHISYFFKVFIV